VELPSNQQIAEAMIEGKRAGDTPEQLDERIEGLCRLSDEDLAAMGVRLAMKSEPAPAIDFAPVPVKRRHDGWTAERQRAFIAALAETGCVSEACGEVGITARSAYRLREHPAAAAFRHAWDHAQSLATVRLTALAWERAVHGTPDRIYKDGVLVAERRKPSDKLLMWLLAHHNTTVYGWASRPPAQAPDMSFFPLQHARAELANHVRNLADVPPADCPADAVPIQDYSDGGEEPAA
jgi:hypothetical protein